MKKILSTLLILALCFIFCIPAFATEQATEEPTQTEETTEATEEASIIDGLLAKFTDSSFWVSVVGVLSAIIASLSGVAVFVNKIKNVTDLVRQKADNETIIKALKDATSETQLEISKKLDETNEALKACTSREEELTTLIALLINNSNINPHAKAEIMARVSGLKEITGTVIEAVKEVEREVEKAKAEEIKPDTPALDNIIGIALS